MYLLVKYLATAHTRAGSSTVACVPIDGADANP